MSSSDDDLVLSTSKKRSRVDSDSDFMSEDDSTTLVKLKAGKKSPSRKKTKVATKSKRSVKTEVKTDVKSKAKTNTKATTTKAKTTKTKTKSLSKPAVTKKKTVTKTKTKTKVAAGATRKLKVHSKSERLDMAIKAYRWWHDEELPDGISWRSLEHNGVMFPPAYEPHGIPLMYNGEQVKLSPREEEMATFYAAMPLDGPQLGNAKTAEIFNANFFSDFKKILGKGHVIKHFKKCNFDAIRTHLDEQREVRKNRTKKEKDVEKEKKTMEQYTNGFALLDGHLEKVGNFRIEPPGLFRGRGEHPKTGTLKERVKPEEVTINVGMDDRVPPCTMPGHAWKEVIHRDQVTWLAYWNENVMNGTKYVWLAASSSFKGKSDLEKYEKARRLKNCIDKIRKDYTKGLKSKDKLTRQRSTAMWVIDVLALRVGNEKGEDEADTVGCCSLRAEHMAFSDENSELTLSFLGKDSMPYNNTIEFEKFGEIGKQVYQNFKRFCTRKKPEDEVFDELTPTELNKHLGSLMPGLSAKVFRTYNASFTLQNELPTTEDLKQISSDQTGPKVLSFNEANRKVAILCNHQRTVSKTHESTMERMTAQLELLKSQENELKDMVKKRKSGKNIRVKTENPSDEIKKKETHLFAKQPNVDQIKEKLKAFKKKVTALELRVQDKEDNKAVALGTSKINYMDPRITVAWCKRNEVPIASVFAKTLREKFVWAMDVPPNWKF